MVERTYLKSVAIFLISLILMIPVYSAGVLATDGFLNVIDAYGQDGKSYYAKSRNDKITFAVNAYVEGDSNGIGVSQVKVYASPFSNCFPGADQTFNCFANDRLFPDMDMCNLALPPFTIILNDDSNQYVDSKDVRLFCDQIPPVMTSLSVSGGRGTAGKLFKPADTVTLGYTVTDSACTDPVKCSGKCVGYKKLEINGGGYSRSIPLNLNTGFRCDGYSGTATIPASSFTQGVVNLNVQIVDNFDQYNAQSLKTETFTVDGIGPSFSDFSIVESGTTREPAYILTRRIPVDIKVKISDAVAGIDTAQVFADLSSLGLYSSVPPNGGCALSGTTAYECLWTGLSAQFSSTSYSIIIKAADVLGNPNQAAFGRTIGSDSTGPTVSGAISIRCNDPSCLGKEIKNIYFTGKENVVIEANFTDAKSGVDAAAEITADLSEIGGSESVTAYNCFIPTVTTLITQNVVSCIWHHKLDLAEGGPKDFIFTATDLAGNEGKISKSYSFTPSKLDSTGPSVLSIVLLNRTKDTSNNYYVGSGENIVKVTFNEDGVGLIKNYTYVTVNSGAPIRTIGCKDSGNWVCDFLVTASADGSIKVHPDSRDDFSNKVTNPDQYEVKFKVDTTEPRLAGEIQKHVSVVSGYPNSKSFFVKDYPIKIKINITELSPSMKAYAIFDAGVVDKGERVEGTCTLNTQTGIYNCAWGYTDTMLISTVVTGDKTISFEFIDIAGNKYSDLSRTITVYEKRDIPTEPFYAFDILEENVLPLDKTVIREFAGDYYYQTFLFNLNDLHKCESALEIVNLKMGGSCSSGVSVNKWEIFQVDEAGSISAYDYSGMITFNWKVQDLLDRYIDNGDYDKDYVLFGDDTCNLELNIRCGTNVFSAPEEHNFQVKVPFATETDQSNSDALLDQIHDLEDRMIEGQALLEIIDDILKWSQRFCEMKSMLATFHIFFDLFGIGSASCVDVDPTGLLQLRGGCSAVEKVANKGKISFMEVVEKIDGVLNVICQFVMCSGADTFKMMGWELKFGPKENAGADDKSGGISICEILKNSIVNNVVTFGAGNGVGGVGSAQWWGGALDYLEETDTLQLSKESFIFALTCGCIPGIYYNIQKIRELQCFKGVCLKYWVPAGTDPAECDQLTNYFTCNYVLGAVWKVVQRLSPTAILEGFLTKISDILTNPLTWGLHGLKLWFKSMCFKGSIGSCSPTPNVPGACAFHWTTNCIPYTVLVSLESIAVLKQMWDSIAYYMSEEEQQSYCDLLLDGVCKGDIDCDEGETCGDDNKCVAAE